MSDNKELTSFLESIWLDPKEAKVYIAALSIWTTPASIIWNKLKIPRSTARYLCDELVKKWLMIYTKKANTKLYTVENPNKLYSILYSEQEKLDKKTGELQDKINIFQKIYNPATSLPKITFYEWVDWTNRLLEEMITDSTNLYSFWAWDYFLSENPEIVKSFRTKAKSKYKNVYVIRAKKYKKLHDSKDPANFKTKYFDRLEELKIDFQITKDKLSIISLNQDWPVWILIKHKDIVEAFQEIFKELWEKLEI